MKKTFLPDVNFWLALSFDHHVHHPSALGWFMSNIDSPMSFCRITQLGFFRLATNEKVMKEFVRTMPQAWEMYDALVSDHRVGIAPEPQGLEQELRYFTRMPRGSTHLWGDAYLAAFAIASEMQMLTFDRAFIQFKLPHCTILS
jgi:toxin-antitoxin system PIN domain toxin